MSVTTLEREIKLRFGSVDEARAAVIASGATPLLGRRLQEDSLLDTDDEQLRRRRCVLRVRVENGKSRLTFKGPVQPALVHVREELETVVGDGAILLRVLQELGLHRRAQVADLVGHGSQQRLRVSVPRGWDDPACQQLAAEIGETEPRACRTDVDAGDEPVARVELHAAGPASPAGRTGAEIVQDAETNQGRGKAAHGRRGKPRGLDELGAGELTLVRDGRRKHALQIETPDVCCVSSGFDVGGSVFEQAHRRVPLPARVYQRRTQYLSALGEPLQSPRKARVHVLVRGREMAENDVTVSDLLS